MKKSIGFVKVSLALSMLVLSSGCAAEPVSEASSQFAEIAEESTGTPKPIQDDAPKLSSELPWGNLSVEPGEIPQDDSELRRALTFFEVVEGLGGDHSGAVDYEYEWDNQQRYAGVQSRGSTSSNRDRDYVALYFWGPDVEVLMNGKTSVWFGFYLDSHEDRIKALCNGVLFEVKEHAFRIPGWQTCSDGDYKYADYDMMPVGVTDAVDGHLIRLLATNGFVAKVLDTDGKEHVFDFPFVRALDVDESCDGSSSIVKCNWSAQDFLTIALQAEEAVSRGLGY